MSWDSSATQRQLQDESLYATDLAEYLVGKGLSFSDAHQAVGRLLAYADGQGVSLRQLPLSEWKRFSTSFGADAVGLLSPSTSVERKKSLGSTNPELVKRQIQKWKTLLR